MEQTLHLAAHYLALALEALALLAIAIGAVEAAIGIFRVMLARAARRAVWLEFARWLIAGLTFQLGADIVHTTITPQLGRDRPGRRHRRDPHVPHLLPGSRHRGRVSAPRRK